MPQLDDPTNGKQQQGKSPTQVTRLRDHKQKKGRGEHRAREQKEHLSSRIRTSDRKNTENSDKADYHYNLALYQLSYRENFDG